MAVSSSPRERGAVHYEGRAPLLPQSAHYRRALGSSADDSDGELDVEKIAQRQKDAEAEEMQFYTQEDSIRHPFLRCIHPESLFWVS